MTTNEILHNHQLGWGILEEESFIGMVRAAGEIGISKYALISMLWPHNPLSQLSLLSRIGSYVNRAKKKYQIQIETNNFKVQLSSKDLKKVGVDWPWQGCAKILESMSGFTAKDFNNFYGLKKLKAMKS